MRLTVTIETPHETGEEPGPWWTARMLQRAMETAIAARYAGRATTETGGGYGDMHTRILVEFDDAALAYAPHPPPDIPEMGPIVLTPPAADT